MTLVSAQLPAIGTAATGQVLSSGARHLASESSLAQTVTQTAQTQTNGPRSEDEKRTLRQKAADAAMLRLHRG